MHIKNIEKTSMVDHPPYISSVVFIEGCNMRCPVCFNYSIIESRSCLPDIPEKELIAWFGERRDKIDSITISGGEACSHDMELIDFTRKIKNLGFKIKLDTNGSFPEVIKILIDNKLVDFIAMDIKSSKDHYNEVCGIETDIIAIEKSIQYIIDSGIDHEFRTTIHPKFHCKSYILDIAKWIKGAKLYSLQQYVKGDVLDPSLNDYELYDKSWFENLKIAIDETGYIDKTQIKTQ